MRGVDVMRGHHEDLDGTAAASTDGWSRSGDLGHVDGDGLLVAAGEVLEPEPH